MSNEEFIRQQVRKQINELFSLSDLKDVVSDFSDLGKILWNDIKFALSSLKLLQAIFTIDDSKALSVLQAWDTETSQYAKENKQLSDALNKSDASLDLFIFAPTVAVSRMLATGTLTTVGDKLALADGTGPGRGSAGRKAGRNRSVGLIGRLQDLFYVSTSETTRRGPLLQEKRIGEYSPQAIEQFIASSVPNYIKMRKRSETHLAEINESIQEILNVSVDAVKKIYEADTPDELFAVLNNFDNRTRQVVRQSYEQSIEGASDKETTEDEIWTIFKTAVNANVTEALTQLHSELDKLFSSLEKKGLTDEVLAASDSLVATSVLETKQRIIEIFEELEELNPEN